MPEIAPDHNQFAYSVSEISFALKRVVEETFGQVRVRGEISGWRGPHGSGHAYFRLKDDKSVLEAVCWRGSLGKMPFKPEEGLEVIAHGRITTYPGSSKYQIVIDFMEPAGIGALMAMLEKRKAALAAEGLFEAARKKPLPFMPAVIGVITSPTGAVIRDILHRLADRFPAHVIVWPVAVQGEGAAEQIANAIEGFNRLGGTPPASSLHADIIPRPDLIIVARGGGSLEDLWAFNEEVVVRAVAASAIPLISAVGHETDTTLIDHAADMRAPTPTAAAELAVPVQQDWIVSVMEMHRRFHHALTRSLTVRTDMLISVARALTHPKRGLDLATQRLDDWTERLNASLPLMLATKRQQMLVATAKLQPASVAQAVARHAQEIVTLSERAQRMALRLITDREQRLSNLAQLLKSLDYAQVLERGFALVRNAQGRLITRAAAIQPGEALELTFRDGKHKARAT